MEKRFIDSYKAGFELFQSASKKIAIFEKYLNEEKNKDLLKLLKNNFTDYGNDYSKILELGSAAHGRMELSRKLSEAYHQQAIALKMIMYPIDEMMEIHGDNDLICFRETLCESIVDELQLHGDVSETRLMELVAEAMRKNLI